MVEMEIKGVAYVSYRQNIFFLGNEAFTMSFDCDWPMAHSDVRDGAIDWLG